jgi:membrane protease YdiL (CAAX protease family)
VSAPAILSAMQDAPAKGEGTASFSAALLYAGVLVAVSAAVLRLALWISDRVCPPTDEVRVPWRLAHVILVMLIMLVSARLLGLAIGPIGDGIIRQLELSSALLGLGSLAALGIAARFGNTGMTALGLRASGNLRAIVAAVATYAACLPGLFGVGIVWSVGLQCLGHEVHEQEILTGFSQLSTQELLVPFVIGSLIQPLFEEVLFRGFLQPTLVAIANPGRSLLGEPQASALYGVEVELRGRLRPAFAPLMHPWTGIVITSILFGALHGLDAFGPVFALSMLLGWIRERTQSLGACWVVHGLHNGGQLAAMFLHPQLLESHARTGMLFP